MCPTVTHVKGQTIMCPTICLLIFGVCVQNVDARRTVLWRPLVRHPWYAVSEAVLGTVELFTGGASNMMLCSVVV